jgi:5-methylcytosine-specific restriction endonuclease McrA
MSASILLLDSSWRIDRIIGVERACELLLAGRVVPASEDIAMLMRSPSTQIEIPEVVARVAGSSKGNFLQPACTPRRVRQRDTHLCQFVVEGRPCVHRGDSVDHLLPRSHGGSSEWRNLVAACRVHNGYKADRTLEEMVTRYGWGLRRRPFVPTREQLVLAGITKARPAWEPFLTAAH